MTPQNVTVFGDRAFKEFSCSVMSDSLQSHGQQHARPPYPSPTLGVDSNSCPLSRWCHPAISSSVTLFSSCFQSFPASLMHAKTLQFRSVAQSCLTLCDPKDRNMPGLPVHHQLPEFTQTNVDRVGDATSSSVIPFSPCLQSFPASGSFQMSQLFASGGQSIGVSASASVLPMNTQDWFPLGWTGWISLQSKGLSRVFSNTTVQKHWFFRAQLSLWSKSNIHTWLLEKHSFD